MANHDMINADPNGNGASSNGHAPAPLDGAVQAQRSQIMTTKEIAKYLGVHEMTVYRWLKKGVLPGFKIGGRWRSKKDLIDSNFFRVEQEKDNL